MTEISVLNWQHRRATGPIEAAIERFQGANPSISVKHSTRPLSDFEHQGIDTIARQYDLIIFDHPFCGVISQSGCFEPLELLIPDLLGEEQGSRYIGNSLASYRFAGHLWGAPIDGATQHALYRADLMARFGVVPKSHADVLQLGTEVRKAGLYLGTAIDTPHAILSIWSYMANLGQPVLADEKSILDIPAESFAQAYTAVADVLALSAPEAAHWNSIDLHQAMGERDDIVYAPVVYGYAAHGEHDHSRPLSFASFAGVRAPYEAGSAIGGTALGLSRYSKAKTEALQFMRFILGDEVQTRIVGEHHGQAATRDGWLQSDLDARFNHFFSAVRDSMETAWVRPRFAGYIDFQRSGGEIVAEGLRAGTAADKVREKLLSLI